MKVDERSDGYSRQGMASAPQPVAMSLVGALLLEEWQGTGAELPAHRVGE
ncbi:MAG: hypothetical protein JW726_00915 [Anaerolineales bacterium]|nr:hypothetical protein [Anaerolineales bacterium]